MVDLVLEVVIEVEAQMKLMELIVQVKMIEWEQGKLAGARVQAPDDDGSRLKLRLVASVSHAVSN